MNLLRKFKKVRPVDRLEFAVPKTETFFFKEKMIQTMSNTPWKKPITFTKISEFSQVCTTCEQGLVGVLRRLRKSIPEHAVIFNITL